MKERNLRARGKPTSSALTDDIESATNRKERLNGKGNGKQRKRKARQKLQTLAQIRRRAATRKFWQYLRNFSRSPPPLLFVTLLMFLFSTFLLYLKMQGIPISNQGRFLTTEFFSRPKSIAFTKEFASPNQIILFPDEPLPDSDDESSDSLDVDEFGNLTIAFFQEESARRQIERDFSLLGNSYRLPDKSRDDDLDGYYNFDDDYERGRYVSHHGRCRRISEHRINLQNCNSFHELELLSMKVKFLGAGAYRQVFSIDHPYRDTHEKFVIKDISYQLEAEEDNIEFVRMDAMVAERLNSSPRTFDIYGFCGLGILSEFFHHGDIEDTVVQGEGYAFEDLQDEEKLKPQNDLDGSEKLVLALEMAEGISVLHGNKGGIIVHDDISLSQFLLNKDKSMLKINDFNRAEFMLWDENKQNYCKYRNGPGGGNWRAPEEFANRRLNEKIDVWSLGNNMYALLTGLYPLYNMYDKIMHKALIGGETAYIDPRYKSRSKEEGKLVEIIERCFQYNPDDRPSIFEVVKFLREAMAECLGENVSRKDVLVDL